MSAPLVSGHVFWLFGLSGAGKSTLADQLTAEIRAEGRSVLRLDGDSLRGGLCAGLAFSQDDRTENLRRAAEVAKLGALSGICVVASFITPTDLQRRLVRQIIGTPQLSLIFLNASLSVCRARDVKGLYAKATAGSVAQMTGVSSPFETPSHPDLTLETGRDSVEDCGTRLNQFAFGKLSPV